LLPDAAAPALRVRFAELSCSTRFTQLLNAAAFTLRAAFGRLCRSPAL
jgi:hypothetical protein